MTRVSMEELAAHLSAHPRGEEALAVEMGGSIVGYYLPIQSAPLAERRLALARLGDAVERLLSETGLSEEELVALFDHRQPIPDPGDSAGAAVLAPRR